MSDVENAIWADLSTAPRWLRALQRAYLGKIEELLKTETVTSEERHAKVEAAQGKGYSAAFAELAAMTSGETVFPAWARASLPNLATRLDSAASKASNPDDELHFKAMAQRARRIAGSQN